MATERHLRAAALLQAGATPEAALIGGGWPQAFAAGFATRAVAWLIGAGVLPEGFACAVGDVAPEPDAPADVPAPEPPAPPEIPAPPDASALDAPSADADPASADPVAPTTDGNATTDAGEARPAKRTRRSRP